jgi:hypothetical protein
MNNKLILLIFGILIFGCTSNQENHEKKENSENSLELNEKKLQALIDQKEDLNLFLSYWYGMTKQEFNEVSTVLLKKKKIIKEDLVLYFNFKIASSETELLNITCTLLPIFDKNNKLLSLGLFPKKNSSCFPSLGNIDIKCIDKIDAARLFQMYNKKYGKPVETLNPKQRDFSENFSIYSDFIKKKKMVRIKEKRTMSFDQKDIERLSQKQHITLRDLGITGDSFVKSKKDLGDLITSFEIHYSLLDYFIKVDTFEKVRADSIKKQTDDLLNEQFENI